MDRRKDVTDEEIAEFNEDIAELKKLMKEGSEILELKDKPIQGQTAHTLVMDYVFLQQPFLRRAPDSVRDYSEIIEGQASWVVLRRFERDEAIARLSRDERLARFVLELERHKDQAFRRLLDASAPETHEYEELPSILREEAWALGRGHRGDTATLSPRRVPRGHERSWTGSRLRGCGQSCRRS